MKTKLLTLGMILGLAACGGGDEAEMDELDTEIGTEAPATGDRMTADTMMMDTADPMLNDTSDMEMEDDGAM